MSARPAFVPFGNERTNGASRSPASRKGMRDALPSPPGPRDREPGRLGDGPGEFARGGRTASAGRFAEPVALGQGDTAEPDARPSIPEPRSERVSGTIRRTEPITEPRAVAHSRALAEPGTDGTREGDAEAVARTAATERRALAEPIPCAESIAHARADAAVQRGPRALPAAQGWPAVRPAWAWT